MILELGICLLLFLAGVGVGWYTSTLKDRKRKAPSAEWDALATGESGNIERERYWLSVMHELYTTFCAKQRDYGPTNISVGGLKGLTVRLGDKTSRLWNLVLSVGAGGPQNEPVRDTLLDLANYAIIGTMVNDDHWPLEQADNVWGTGALRQLLAEMESD